MSSRMSSRVSLRSVRPLAAVILTFVVVGVVAGCSSHRSMEDEMTSSAQAVSDTLHFRAFETDEPITLKTSGPIAVQVENFRGGVEVRADTSVKQATVEVRRVSTMGIGRYEESEKALADITWRATLEPREGGGDTLVIHADSSNAEPYFFHADILVIAPAVDTVSVRTSHGDVTVIENQGPVDILTSRGDVRMLTPWPMTQPMKIITSQGTIDYRVRGESKGAFDAASHGGEVRQRCEFGLWRALAAENDQDRLVATLNAGTNPVVLRTSEKNIRIAVVADPANVGTAIVDP